MYSQLKLVLLYFVVSCGVHKKTNMQRVRSENVHKVP